jgi:alkanesulfonate monooxygenase SsuD/methylene tetrahydromethanopterin reductase-like flavin-dependent oxidoreductase (luciferase family)
LILLRRRTFVYVGREARRASSSSARDEGTNTGAIKFGIRWPDFDVPIEVGTVRAFIHAAEDLGFDHVTTFDHIAGVSDESLGKSSHFPPHFEFGEALTMIACMAGITNSLGFLTDILNVGYRPTALTAKQVGTIDHLTNGKMRLGLGIEAVPPEYDLMGVGHLYKQRGARVIEQIEVLRLLWTDPEASFEGEWHSFKGCGLNPLPKRPIPIWMGMNWNPPPQVFKRIGRYADGVLPPWVPGEKAYEVRERIYEAAREAGRDPSSIGFEPRINLRTGSGEAPRTHLARPTTSSASTSGGGRSSVRSTWSSRRASAD